MDREAKDLYGSPKGKKPEAIDRDNLRPHRGKVILGPPGKSKYVLKARRLGYAISGSMNELLKPGDMRW